LGAVLGYREKNGGTIGAFSVLSAARAFVLL
jgi:hypothetical protein